MSILSVDNISPIGSGTTLTLNATETKVNNFITVGTGASVSSPSSNVLTLGTNSSERLRITSGGNVNIGTSETTQTARMLNVYGGTARVTQTSGGNTIEAFGGTTSGQSYGLLVNAGTTANDYAATFRNSSGTTMFRVRGDGSIRVGDNLSLIHI